MKIGLTFTIFRLNLQVTSCMHNEAHYYKQIHAKKDGRAQGSPVQFWTTGASTCRHLGASGEEGLPSPEFPR